MGKSSFRFGPGRGGGRAGGRASLSGAGRAAIFVVNPDRDRAEEAAGRVDRADGLAAWGSWRARRAGRGCGPATGLGL